MSRATHHRTDAWIYSAQYRTDCHRIILCDGTQTFLAVCCVFFAAAGAHLNLAALAANWVVVFAICAVRLAAIWMGATIAAGANGLTPTATRWAWAGFVPQAGISLALAAQITVEFPNENGRAVLQQS